MLRRKSYLTSGGLKQLQEELGHLKNTRRPQVATRIHKASDGGGTVDNAEYDEAKNEQAFVEGRIRHLENILSNAVVPPSQKKTTNSVGFGSSVTVMTNDGRRRRYTLVGSAEAAPLVGHISNESPVGRALLGRMLGDKVEVNTPSGMTELTITKIH